VKTLLFHIPTYPSGTWSFQLATKGEVDVTKVEDECAERFGTNHLLNYYNAAVHRAAFALPNYVKRMLNEL